MAKTDKFTTAQMIGAIKANSGMLTHVADSMGCSYQTVRNYINKHPSVKEAFEDSRNRMADRIETTLYSIAVGKPNRDGTWEQEPNVTALIFLAKTHPAMRERGYAERQEITGANGSAIQTQQTNVNIAAESAHDASNILKQLAELGAIPSEPSATDNHAVTE